MSSVAQLYHYHSNAYSNTNTGTNLIMDEISPITCASANSSSYEVMCWCSEVTERYNVESYECVSSCLPGEMWLEQDTGFEMIAEVTEKGRCISCPLGKSSVVGSWECQNLPSGQYGTGSLCPSNTYSKGGAVECTKCSSGKYSDTGASKCIECDFMFRLSKHCDFPVAGMMLISSLLIIVVVASLLFRRYKKKQDRIKQQLRIDLRRQKQLVKTKQTDINLLTGAWKLSAKEIQAHERVASGAYGEVWKGALHNRWVVAIKKLFPSMSSSSSSSISQSSSTRKKGRSRRRTGSRTSKSLFKDTEIKFLMRTLKKHENVYLHHKKMTPTPKHSRISKHRYSPRTSRHVLGLWYQ